jgi:hypothetical protein
MPVVVPLFDILEVIRIKHTSESALPPKGWLKDMLLSDFGWLERATLTFIIQALLNFYQSTPLIPFEWIVHSLNESNESTERFGAIQVQPKLKPPLAQPKKCL